MNRTQMERIYRANNRENYRLETLYDLLNIHGIDYKVKGYSSLSKSDRIGYEEFLINYMNCLGMEKRMRFLPIGIHRVEQTCYSRKELDEDEVCYIEFARDVVDLATGIYLKKYRDEEHDIKKASDVTKEEILRIDFIDQSEDVDSVFREQWLHIIESGTQWY